MFDEMRVSNITDSGKTTGYLSLPDIGIAYVWTFHEDGVNRFEIAMSTPEGIIYQNCDGSITGRLHS